MLSSKKHNQRAVQKMPTLYPGIKCHVEHRPAQTIGGGLRARNDEFSNRENEIILRKRRGRIGGALLHLVQVGVDVMPWRLDDPILWEALDDLQKEVVHLVGIAKELLVLPEGQVLHPWEGVVHEGPAACGQLHVLAEDLNHVLKIAVVVSEALAKDNVVGDVGYGIGDEMFGVERLSVVLVNGV